MRNLAVWAGTIAVGVVLWWFTARVSLQFIDPAGFLVAIAIAAAALTALLWWEIATSDGDAAADTQDTRED
ncbi:hypothetical protein DLJ53_21610 [Acuticoccus sediminis]|uniref:Uncharacterized protein n=1 Tax=Acuticoccus sediminis TaxID=2184697 RepID=A0A8B2NLU1_9HYPH|nr:hypothetical protein [Acuticoccus sediminis]RAH99148.1 hypothetical protein DLJ53_21610 [Acuticoccus sediminis]